MSKPAIKFDRQKAREADVRRLRKAFAELINVTAVPPSETQGVFEHLETTFEFEGRTLKATYIVEVVPEAQPIPAIVL